MMRFKGGSGGKTQLDQGIGPRGTANGGRRRRRYGGCFDPNRQVDEATIEMIGDLKAAFAEAASAFNQLKASTLGQIRIYGISKTKADFMLFRNGYKLIFSMRQPGTITVAYSSAVAQYVPGQTPPLDEKKSADLLLASWGAFGQLIWTYNQHSINVDYLVRYYMSRFVKDSAR